MYKLDPNNSYTMPTLGRFRDPRPWEQGGMRYGKVTAISVSYRSDPEALERCLPAPFRVDADPIVTICAQKCEDVDWLAGHGYHLVGFDIASVFDGEVDRDVHGGFCVAMWEDMCEPILGGRDHSGVPKIFSDIVIEQTAADAWRVELSRFDHTFLRFGASELKELDRPQRDAFEVARRNANWMNYKYIPRLENDGADVEYAALYPSSGQCAAAWEGRSDVEFFETTARQAPTQHDYINILGSLPIRELLIARVVHWNEVRALDRLPKRLK